MNPAHVKKTADSLLRISVVIPAYNVGTYIHRALESVLAQSRPPEEIIVVDDGSTDTTADQVKQYGDRIKYMYQDNAGGAAARNTGIRTAEGNWIAFLDADDEWLPEKLQLQADLVQRHNELVWVTGNYYRCLCEEHRRRLDISAEKIAKLLQGKDYFDNFFSVFLHQAYGCTDTMLIKKKVLDTVGGFPEGQKNVHDMDLWWRIGYRWPRIGCVNRPLAIYHMDRPQSLTVTEQKWKQYSEMIERQLKLARAAGKLEDFKPCAVRMLRMWMRSMLFDAQAEHIRRMLTQFKELLPGGYTAWMWFLTAFPRTTAAGCRQISRIVRRLRLRRRLVRKPPPAP